MIVEELTARLSMDGGDFTSKLGEMGKAFEEFAGGLEDHKIDFSKLVIGIDAVILAISGIGLAAMKASSDFQRAMNLVQANLDLSTKDADKMKQAINQIMTDVPVPEGYKDLAEAFRVVGSEGYNMADSIKIVTESAKAAYTTGDSVAHVAGSLATKMHDFGASANEAGEYLGVLHEIMVRGNVKMEDLSQVFGPLSAAARAYGLDIKDLGAAYSALTVAGEDASTSATYLKDVLTSIAVPHKKAAEAALSMGLAYDFTAKGLKEKGLIGVLNDVEKATGGNIQKIRELFPLQQSYNAVLDLLADKGKYVNESLKVMGGGMEALSNSENLALQSTDAQWTLSTQKFQAAFRELGDVLLPLIATEMLPAINELASSLGSWIRDHQADITAFVEKLKEIARVIFVDIKTAVTEVFTAGKSWVDQHKTEIEGFLQSLGQLYEKLKGPLATVFAEVGRVASVFFEAIMGFFNFLKNNQWAMDALVTAITVLVGMKVTGGILGFLSSLKNSLLEVVGINTAKFSTIGTGIEGIGTSAEKSSGKLAGLLSNVGKLTSGLAAGGVAGDMVNNLLNGQNQSGAGAIGTDLAVLGSSTAAGAATGGLPGAIGGFSIGFFQILDNMSKETARNVQQMYKDITGQISADIQKKATDIKYVGNQMVTELLKANQAGKLSNDQLTRDYVNVELNAKASYEKMSAEYKKTTGKDLQSFDEYWAQVRNRLNQIPSSKTITVQLNAQISSQLRSALSWIMPSHAAGGLIPEDQIAQIHKGEYVLPADVVANIQNGTTQYQRNSVSNTSIDNRQFNINVPQSSSNYKTARDIFHMSSLYNAAF